MLRALVAHDAAVGAADVRRPAPLDVGAGAVQPGAGAAADGLDKAAGTSSMRAVHSVSSVISLGEVEAQLPSSVISLGNFPTPLTTTLPHGPSDPSVPTAPSAPFVPSVAGTRLAPECADLRLHQRPPAAGPLLLPPAGGGGVSPTATLPPRAALRSVHVGLLRPSPPISPSFSAAAAASLSASALLCSNSVGGTGNGANSLEEDGS